jgi:two-component system, NarL family, nitrate/nitrite response regulator NarL
MAAPIRSETTITRVLVADTAPMNSQMLAEVLAKHKDFAVFEAAPTSNEVLAAIAEHQPHVAVVSSTPGERDGVSLTESICGSFPAIRVLQLLDRSEPEAVVRAFRSGARGVFCRTNSLELLARCITRLREGHVWANTQELNFVMDALSVEGAGPRKFAGSGNVKLSRRELDVTRCVAEGLTNREIASRLGLTEHTVKNYLFRIFDKVGVSSRVELVLFALSPPAGPEPPKVAVLQKPPARSERPAAAAAPPLARKHSAR